MPGPGNKKNKNLANNQKQKIRQDTQNTVQDSIPSSLANDVDDADGYLEKVNVICRLLQIPDLTSRSGLKLIHKDFDQIYARLDSVYTMCNGNDTIASSVIAIYAKMCADTILRDRLFTKGVLSKIIPLTSRQACRLVALQSLCALTHHGNQELCSEMAKAATIPLLDLLDKGPDNGRMAELVVTVISHFVTSLTGGLEVPSAAVLKSLQVPKLLRSLMEQIRKTSASSLLIDHALGILVALALPCSTDLSKCTPALNFIFACTRSPDIQTRGQAVNGILRLAIKEGKSDDGIYDAQAFLESLKSRMPDHLVDALMDFGPMTSGESFQIALAMRSFQDAMMKVVQDQDLYALGLKVSDLILQTEYSVFDGMFQSENMTTGQMDNYDFGLPFRRWIDSLPHCATALRAAGNPALLDKADIIDLKYLILKRRMDEAQTFVSKSLERNPKVAFFYYIKSLGSDKVDALREAKKGLKCKELTGYVRNAILYRACELAYGLGLERIQTASTDKEWDEGIAFIVGALKDAKTFMDAAPPDARCMMRVVYHHFSLELIIRGSEISVDFEELKDATARLSLADEYARYVRRPIIKTQMRLAREMAMTHMSAASKDWGERVKEIADLHAYKSRKESRVIEPEKSEDILSAWLENVHLDECDAPAPRPRAQMTHSSLHLNNVALYQCSWCETTSAVLRKCGRCKKTRYCDGACQKQHWSVHRSVCSGNTTTTT